MKKFVFELEDVLKYRSFEQQQAEVELGKALAAEQEIQNKIDALAGQLVESKRLIKGSTDFFAISDANKFSEFVKVQTEFLLKQLAELKLISDQKREILKQAMQKTDALKKLKETQEEEYKAAQKKIEAKQIDDIVNSKYARKAGSDLQ